MKRFKRLIQKTVMLFAGGTAASFLAAFCCGQMLPDHFLVSVGQTFSINHPTIVSVPLSDSIEDTQEGDSYNVSLKLFGLIPVKEATVNVVERPVLIPCGTPFGIKMFTEGVVVVALSEVQTSDGARNPAEQCGLKVGDVIIAANGEKVRSNAQIAEIIANCNGKSIELAVIRNHLELSISLRPIKDSGGEYKAGIWVRDSSAGIGTATFYEPSTGLFAGLGHGICDIDTGEILPLSSGKIVDVTILGVHKGVSGTPGELVGTFSSTIEFGELYLNAETGVFGYATHSPTQDAEPVRLALKQEIQTGKATILTTLDNNQVEKFEIEIEKINLADTSPTKNMVIHITDPDLLEKTGGIVQGMSGSPILQNGRLVGAVTHVFVNDPTRGFAIFAENMLTTAQEIAEQNSAA